MNTVSTELARIVGKRVEMKKTAREVGHSNFQFVGEFLNQHGVIPYNTQLLRIFSLARKLRFQSVLVDEISSDESPFLTEENDALRNFGANDFKFSHSQVFKFSFFGNGQNGDKDSLFLGYAIFKIDHFHDQKSFGHVFEAVLTPPRTIQENSFLHCKRRYVVSNTEGTNFHVTGSLYAQQNGKTFVCAHVALRTALSHLLPEGDIRYSRIRTLAGSHQKLSPDQMERVFHSQGVALEFTKRCYEPFPRPCLTDQTPCKAAHLLDNKINYNKELYGLTESCVPAILGFNLADGRRHVVPILGHTFDEDSWVPSSNQCYFSQNFRFFSSEQWLGSHLIHDDNFGPYFCLPRHFLEKSDFRILYGINYDKSAFFASEAEATALMFLHRAGKTLLKHGKCSPWSRLFIAFKDYLVLRAIYIDRAGYIQHLTSGPDSITQDGNDSAIVAKIEKVLPNKFWMIEASTIELFPVTRRKFGEVILAPHDPEDTNTWNTSFIMMRLPGCYFFRNHDPDGKWIYEDSAFKEHSQVFSHPDI